MIRTFMVLTSGMLFFLSLLSSTAMSQAPKQSRITVSMAHLNPNSKNTFKKSYGGIIGLNLTYSRKVTQDLFVGGLFEYSRFEIDDPELLALDPVFFDTKMKTYSIGVIGGFALPIHRRISSAFQIGLGYSWISFKNSSVNFSSTESGPLLRPSVDVQYLFSKIGFSVSVAYPIVLEHFADEMASEDSTIRWWSFSGGIVYAF